MCPIMSDGEGHLALDKHFGQTKTHYWSSSLRGNLCIIVCNIEHYHVSHNLHVLKVLQKSHKGKRKITYVSEYWCH